MLFRSKAGYISRTHGLKGGMAVNLTPGSTPTELSECWLDSGESYERFEVEEWSARPDMGFIKLAGVESLEAARALRGRSLFLMKTGRPKARKGSFHDDEIVGFSVVDATAGEIGTIASVSRQGGRGFLMVKKERREFIIPLDGPFLTAIDKKKRLASVSLPEGFLDI